MPRSDAQKFKEQNVKTLPRTIGVYALCDLNEVPVYVGKSEDGLQHRIRRHLTSARSDPIANRQIDVWEIAYVWAWPVQAKEHMPLLERYFFNLFNQTSPLVNGKALKSIDELPFEIPDKIRVQVITDELIIARREPLMRFPRQIHHFGELVDYILNTQDKKHLRRALAVYYDRLTRYLDEFLERAPRGNQPDHKT